MKKLLLIALIAFGAWNYYQKQNATVFAVEDVPQVLPDYSASIYKDRAVANTPRF